jgi:hypothetical protein
LIGNADNRKVYENLNNYDMNSFSMHKWCKKSHWYADFYM